MILYICLLMGCWLLVSVLVFWKLRSKLLRYRDQHGWTPDDLRQFNKDAYTDQEYKNFLTYIVLTHPLWMFAVNIVFWPFTYKVTRKDFVK